jgi:glycosyltransferase involved in cell wall biosynthesis
MKIAFITNYIGTQGVGGSEDLWSQAASHLKEEGQEVFANGFNITMDAPWFSFLKEKGIAIEKRPLVKSLRYQVGTHLGLYSEYRWLDRVKPDVVVISLGGNLNGFDWMRACNARRIPYVIIVQLILDWNFPSDREAAVGAELYKKARAVFFVAQSNRQALENHLGVRLNNARPLRNAYRVSYDEFVNWPDHDRGWKAACVARLQPRDKGQELLMEVLNQPKWRERHFSATLFGMGRNGTALKRLKEFYDNQSNVHLEGHVNKVTWMWRNHHLLVLPSRQEGTPLALIEAMFCGRPAVVTNIGGMADLVEDGVTGFIAPVPHVRCIDEALERAWEARDRWEEMGLEARKRIRRIYPRHPGAKFAEELMALMERKGKTAASAAV